MRALDTIKPAKFEAEIQYLNVYLFFFATLVIKLTKYRNCSAVCNRR